MFYVQGYVIFLQQNYKIINSCHSCHLVVICLAKVVTACHLLVLFYIYW